MSARWITNCTRWAPSPLLLPASDGFLWPRVAIQSDIGRVRQDNQDSVFGLTAILPSGPGSLPVPFGFFAVADGMGGLLNGGVASQTAIQRVAGQVLRELLLPALSGREGSAGQQTVAEVLGAALRDANGAIFAAARQAGQRSGTTFSGAVLFGSQLVTGHVGDSRIYLYGPTGLTLLTHDHSLVARLVALGQFTEEDARSSPQRNALYRALGQAETIEVESASRSWRGAYYLLLCSDGLWDLVPDDEIAATLRAAAGPESAAEEFVRRANARGGPDNVSAIVVQLPQVSR